MLNINAKYAVHGAGKNRVPRATINPKGVLTSRGPAGGSLGRSNKNAPRPSTSSPPRSMRNLSILMRVRSPKESCVVVPRRTARRASAPVARISLMKTGAPAASGRRAPANSPVATPFAVKTLPASDCSTALLAVVAPRPSSPIPMSTSRRANGITHSLDFRWRGLQPKRERTIEWRVERRCAFWHIDRGASLNRQGPAREERADSASNTPCRAPLPQEPHSLEYESA